ncbi:hypothetical protein GW17_00018044 [Ensete ventricosum]|nr:hypothetical protein GW17_00018044 [Ensete ventricosum]
MLQRAHQYMAAETLVAGKRDETKRPRVEQPRGHPPSSPKKKKKKKKKSFLSVCALTFGAWFQGSPSGRISSSYSRLLVLCSLGCRRPELGSSIWVEFSCEPKISTVRKPCLTKILPKKKLYIICAPLLAHLPAFMFFEDRLRVLAPQAFAVPPRQVYCCITGPCRLLLPFGIHQFSNGNGFLQSRPYLLRQWSAKLGSGSISQISFQLPRLPLSLSQQPQHQTEIPRATHGFKETQSNELDMDSVLPNPGSRCHRTMTVVMQVSEATTQSS